MVWFPINDVKGLVLKGAGDVGAGDSNHWPLSGNKILEPPGRPYPSKYSSAFYVVSQQTQTHTRLVNVQEVYLCLCMLISKSLSLFMHIWSKVLL